MEPVLERVPRGGRIAVIRLRSLGDCVLTTPALRLLKAHRPDLAISVVVEDRFRAVFERSTDIDFLLPPEPAAVARMRPDLCLNLHGGTRSAVLTIASRAPIRAGFGHYRWPAAYNIRIPRAQEILGEERMVHTAEHLASAMFYLGVPRQEIPRARLFAEPVRRPKPYVVIHPFASQPDKTWPADGFLAVARKLSAELDPVFLAGPQDDASAFVEFETLANAPLGEAMSLIAGASLFIGNDSGPAHIAAAYGVPVAVLFGTSNPVIWAPWKTQSRILENPDGIGAISAAEVLAAAEALKAPA